MKKMVCYWALFIAGLPSAVLGCRSRPGQSVLSDSPDERAFTSFVQIDQLVALKSSELGDQLHHTSKPITDLATVDGAENKYNESVMDVMDEYNWKTGYNYMPKEKVVVCSCAKCGSTSLYNFLYAEVFGQEWPYAGAPEIHDVTSPRWENRFLLIQKEEMETLMADPEVFTFSLLRDPRKRLVSAWKSKVACGNKYGTDFPMREVLVPKFLRLAYPDSEDNRTCLDFHEFVRGMYELVVKQRLSTEINIHFRPQQFDCFNDFALDEWSQATKISSPAAAQQLSERLGRPIMQFPLEHGSEEVSQSSHQSEEDKRRWNETLDLLDMVTQSEYKSLGITPEPWVGI